ncbi:amino acid permease [Vagococcus xieshaowenii]|uniref:Amino acid permease n=1 Tax=Vagococcus xieshaowenii TaxID=2562451 RepID=A0AAJ5EE42_9ENTE|nr:amino acid permease [Vagococcus xieshaowenii]QCA29132.1 amino acid permease [Vagococcus xieshaowenii]TFZ40891.1 amino acid permease [Vagococcus xieshaowenii]
MEKKLENKMSTKHITMLALGGAIGAGLFKGSGEAIGIAGPAVLISYLLGGLLLFVVMYGLGQMVVHNQTGEGGLSGILKPYLGDRTGDFIDWTYWIVWMVNIIAEAVAASSFLQLWFPSISTWVFVLIIALLTTMINLYSVRVFAETEYWLAVAKISVIIVLIVLAVILVVGQVFDVGFQSAFSNLTNNGGFVPTGFKGILSSMLVVIYSYAGSEMLAITVSETENPKQAIPQAIKGVMGRIVSFYILPLLFLLIIYPWETLASSPESPFVLVFEKMKVPFAGDVVNFVIILALFSSINSGVYATSRTLYFRLKDQTGISRKLAQLNKQNVPQRAVLFCSSILYAGVVLSMIVGDNLFNYLVSSISYSMVVVWLLITLASFKLFTGLKQRNKQWMTGIVIIVLLGLLVSVIITNPWAITLFTTALYVIILVRYQLNRK